MISLATEPFRKDSRTRIWNSFRIDAFAAPIAGVSLDAPSLPPSFIEASKADYKNRRGAVIAARVDQKEAASILALADGVWRAIVTSSRVMTRRASRPTRSSGSMVVAIELYGRRFA